MLGAVGQEPPNDAKKTQGRGMVSFSAVYKDVDAGADGDYVEGTEEGEHDCRHGSWI